MNRKLRKFAQEVNETVQKSMDIWLFMLALICVFDKNKLNSGHERPINMIYRPDFSTDKIFFILP